MTIQGVTQYARTFIAISKDPKEQHLCISERKVAYEDGCGANTSTSFDFKNGFLMYHVEVRKVRANITSSFFPDSSREFGECLNQFAQLECVNSGAWEGGYRTMNSK